MISGSRKNRFSPPPQAAVHQRQSPKALRFALLTSQNPQQYDRTTIQVKMQVKTRLGLTQTRIRDNGNWCHHNQRPQDRRANSLTHKPQGANVRCPASQQQQLHMDGSPSQLSRKRDPSEPSVTEAVHNTRRPNSRTKEPGTSHVAPGSKKLTHL